MKALMLIGGQGTRLRPFTNDVPKPLLPVVNQPMMSYQLDLLRRAGIRDVVLCTSYRAEVVHRTLKEGRKKGLRLHYVHEPAPLGTGGAVRNAERYADETVLILNGDLLNAVDVKAFYASHRKNGADVSITLIRVKDPTQYGLVEIEPENGRIRRFLEKPSWDEINTNTINAGAYLFEPAVVRKIPAGVPYSLERGLFPALLEERRRLFGFVIKGYWIDVGTVDKYLQVHLDFLAGQTGFHYQDGLSRKKGFLAGPGVKLGGEISREGPGAVVLGRGTRVGSFVRFIGSVSIGENCSIGQGAQLDNCVVLSGTRIGDGASLKRCVVGRRCRLGAHAVVSPGRALGDGSSIQKFSQL